MNSERYTLFEGTPKEGDLALDKPDGPGSIWRTVILASTTTSQLVIPVLVGVAIGYYMDRRFGTAPFFLVILLLVGVFTGVFALWRTLSRWERRDGRYR